jgi:hypothetical protein
LDKLAIRIDRRFIVGDDLALMEEFGLVRSLQLSAVAQVSSEAGEAHGGNNTQRNHCDGETYCQHVGSPFDGYILYRTIKAPPRSYEEARKN